MKIKVASNYEILNNEKNPDIVEMVTIWWPRSNSDNLDQKTSENSLAIKLYMELFQFAYNFNSSLVHIVFKTIFDVTLC